MKQLKRIQVKLSLEHHKKLEKLARQCRPPTIADWVRQMIEHESLVQALNARKFKGKVVAAGR